MGGFWCPSKDWNVRFDDPEMPWWSWSKLVTFWVDGNWFHGSIPGELMVERWPNLRTLDLYDNNLTGTFPEKIEDMRDLEFVQFQGNWLSGTVPDRIFDGRFRRLKLSVNPNLTGCIPSGG